MTHTATHGVQPAESAARPGPPPGSLAHFPVPLFASVIEPGGLSLTWRRAAAVWASGRRERFWLRRRWRRVPFRLPVWPDTFPLAAAAAAAISMAGARPRLTYDAIAALLLAGTTVLVLAVAGLTVRAAARHKVCVPE